ncbi:GerAB/ArcD/ProY family transporter [Paenibacillus guangzhouensis]|uniref:GerAB/ArcD/ProY family transporter n=1 Tax=Paenibacillus guangzhouensis TaxID=1473112 RepID=UPI001266E22E|nr:endospore germination permease [Paenibacillus guangzhouensis]
MLEKGIGNRQLTILVILYTIGDSILVLPSIVASAAEQDAWISGILGVTIAPLLVVFLYDALRRCYPEMTLIAYSHQILGKWLGMIMSLLFLSYFFITSATYLREVGDFMTSQILHDTPILMVMILFLSVVLMAVRLGLEPMVRSAEVLFPVLIFMMFILILFLLPEIQLKKLKPIFDGGLKPILEGSIPFIVLPFMEPVAVLMILPFVSQKNAIRKSLFIGQWIAGSVLIIITFLSLLILGPESTSRNIYPSYILARKINIGDILIRLEAILAVIWFITIFIRFSLFLYVTALGLAQTLKINDYRPLVYPLGLNLIFFSLIMAPDTTYYNNLIANYWPFYALTFGFIFPLLLLTIAKVRKKDDPNKI